MSQAALPRPTLGESIALVWRSLRSMRTALVLLLTLALASVAGSLVPQVGTSDARIAAIFRDHPLRAQLYDRIGLFDVYGSWWFTLVYALLIVSLVACLVPRTRALVRNLRLRPQAARELESMRHYAERRVTEAPDRVVATARRALRRRLFRVSSAGTGDGGWVAADKGLAREAGSLLFHWAFLLLVVGVAWGKGTGFTGSAVIAEGQTWTDAYANYDGQIHEGRFSHDEHTGIRIKVDSFRATYRIPSGIPKDFVTTAELFHADGAPAGTVRISPNHPAEIDGVKIYQFGYGWAPVISVEKDGVPLTSGPVECSQGPPPTGVSPLQLPWNCVVKLPSLRPQVGIRFLLWPDLRGLQAVLTTGRAMPMLGEYQPVLTYTAYRGNLRSDLATPSDVLDTSAMRRWGRGGVIAAGKTVDVGDGIDVTFRDLKRYTVLEVKRDRGLGLVLGAAILVLVGLLPALYTSRRRIWVTATPVGDEGRETLVRIGGFALQRRPQFEQEFDRVVSAIASPPPGARGSGGDADGGDDGEPAEAERSTSEGERVRT